MPDRCGRLAPAPRAAHLVWVRGRVRGRARVRARVRAGVGVGVRVEVRVGVRVRLRVRVRPPTASLSAVSRLVSSAGSALAMKSFFAANMKVTRPSSLNLVCT